MQKILRSLALRDKFVVAVGGMSDTAGHGNKHSEAYPAIFHEALKPVFAAAGVEFELRNFASGGIPSFPNSLCMNDHFGSDVDLIIWDFRMVRMGQFHKRDLTSESLFIIS